MSGQIIKSDKQTNQNEVTLDISCRQNNYYIDIQNLPEPQNYCTNQLAGQIVDALLANIDFENNQAILHFHSTKSDGKSFLYREIARILVHEKKVFFGHWN